ncbi:hypothetical protein D3C81_2332010 [compost metagenome]
MTQASIAEMISLNRRSMGAVAALTGTMVIRLQSALSRRLKPIIYDSSPCLA